MRILCLHGVGSNPDLLRSQLGIFPPPPPGTPQPTRLTRPSFPPPYRPPPPPPLLSGKPHLPPRPIHPLLPAPSPNHPPPRPLPGMVSLPRLAPRPIRARLRGLLHPAHRALRRAPRLFPGRESCRVVAAASRVGGEEPPRQGQRQIGKGGDFSRWGFAVCGVYRVGGGCAELFWGSSWSGGGRRGERRRAGEGNGGGGEGGVGAGRGGDGLVFEAGCGGDRGRWWWRRPRRSRRSPEGESGEGSGRWWWGFFLGRREEGKGVCGSQGVCGCLGRKWRVVLSDVSCECGQGENRDPDGARVWEERSVEGTLEGLGGALWREDVDV